MGDLFDPQDLLAVPYADEVFGPLAIVYLIIFIAGFLTATALYFRPPARLKDHALRRRLSGRIAQAFMWAFGVGLVFFAFRVMGLPGLGIRLWLYVTALGVAGVLGYVVYHLRRHYPEQLAAYEAQQLKRQYLQASRRRPVDADGVALPRSPRAEKRRQRSGGARRR